MSEFGEPQVQVFLELKGRFTVSSLTEDWSDEEKQKLADDDPVAWDCLREDAWDAILANYNDADLTVYYD